MTRWVLQSAGEKDVELFVEAVSARDVASAELEEYEWVGEARVGDQQIRVALQLFIWLYESPNDEERNCGAKR